MDVPIGMMRCPECNGYGQQSEESYDPESGDEVYWTWECDRCKGLGYVPWDATAAPEIRNKARCEVVSGGLSVIGLYRWWGWVNDGNRREFLETDSETAKSRAQAWCDTVNSGG